MDLDDWMRIKQCKTKEQFEEAKRVVKEYLIWLNIDIDFQNIKSEFENFSKIYSPPDGAFYLVKIDKKLAGGVGFKRLEDSICEIKRLYVYPDFRGKGVGKTLLDMTLTLAKNYGYSRARLDTLERMKEAITLYKSFGFKEISPYYLNPLPKVKYFEINL